jgi:hypothetical protein
MFTHVYVNIQRNGFKPWIKVCFLDIKVNGMCLFEGLGVAGFGSIQGRWEE